MLSPEQKDNLRQEWHNRPAGEKKIIMAEFLREHGNAPGWETWLIFLGQRLSAAYFEKSPEVPDTKNVTA